jgi:rubredoxin
VPPADCADCAAWSASGVCRLSRLVCQCSLQTVQTGLLVRSAECADWSASEVCRVCRLVHQQGLQIVQTGLPAGCAEWADQSASRVCRVCRLVHQQHTHVRLSKHFRCMIHALQSLYQCGRLPTYPSAGTCVQVAVRMVGDSSHLNYKSSPLSC